MKLNSPRRLIREDYPGKYRDLTDKLILNLNQFVEEVSLALNKRLNFKDNFEAFEAEIQYTAGTAIAVRNELNSPIRGATVLRVDTLTNAGEVLTSSPFIQFTNTTNQININNITGLTLGNKYRLLVVFFI